MRTTLFTVLCIAIRLGAVLLVVNIIEQLPFLFWHSREGSAYTLYLLMTGILGIVVAAVLWVRPGVLAWWAIGKGQREILESPIGADQLQHVAFSVLGMWMLIAGLGGCVSHLMVMFFLRARVVEAATGVLPASEWRYVVYYLLQAALGVSVVVGSRGLIQWLRQLRNHPVSDAQLPAGGTATSRDD